VVLASSCAADRAVSPGVSLSAGGDAPSVSRVNLVKVSPQV
jgi:hypothetical protein